MRERDLPRAIRPLSHIGRVGEVWRCARRLRDWKRITEIYLGWRTAHYPLAITTVDGVSMTVENFAELVTAWVVFCRQEYSVSRRATTILDLGANYGAFTLFAAATAHEAQIVGVEPYPKSFSRLVDHVAVMRGGASPMLASRDCWRAR